MNERPSFPLITRVRLRMASFILLLIMVFTTLFLVSRARPQSEANGTPIARPSTQTKGLASRPAGNKPDSKTMVDDDHLLEEMLGYFKEDGTRRWTFNIGSERIEVEGASRYEDPITGVVSIKGMKRLFMPNGDVIETSDGVLTYDPITRIMTADSEVFKRTAPNY